MAEGVKLTQTRIRAGHWEGILTGAGATPPALDVVLQGKSLGVAQVQPVPGRAGDYAVRVAIPAEALSEGVQTFLIRQDDQLLAHFTIVTGGEAQDDLRAELDLIRAELDLLKRAFRRHCVETAAEKPKG